jgi:hypothetical protein
MKLNIQESIPLYSIFILLLILSGGYIIQLIPCKLQSILNNNIYIKHFFALLTLIFLITLVDPLESKNNLNIILSKSFILYIFFIFIIKTHYKFFISIMIILGIKYLILLKKNELSDKYEKDKDVNIQKELDNINIIQNVLFFIIIILIIIGFLVYLGQKKYEYKKDFNYFIFLFGKPECNYTIEKISITNSLKHAFNTR